MTTIVIFIGIIFIISLFKFNSNLKEDKKELSVEPLEEKFQIITNILNEQAFLGKATIIKKGNREYELFEKGSNQLINFHYSTGHLTITWKYKYYQKEIIHTKQYDNVRNLSIFQQGNIANDMIKEMNVIVENHKKNVNEDNPFIPKGVNPFSISNGNKEDCYLIKSGVFNQEIIDEDKLENWNDILRDNKSPQNIKDLINEFMIPYKISPLKTILNKECYESPFGNFDMDSSLHIAPTLKKLKENNFDIPMGYPNWFIISFPDVVFWAMKGYGHEIIMKKFNTLNDDEINDGNYICANLLHYIIKLYLKSTNKLLECKKY